MSLIGSTAIPAADTEWSIEYSVLLVGAHCEGEITQTAGDRKTHTISFWHKRAPIGTGTGAGELNSTTNDLWGTPSEGDTLRFNGSQLGFFRNGESDGALYTTAKFRDCSAWYHFVIAIDTTQATAANRIKMYINGVQQTDFSTETYPDQNSETKLMQNGQVFRIGAGHGGTTSADGQGYNAEFIIVDGAQKAATDFGEFDEDSGIWKPKQYTGDFNTGDGTNGAHYKFEGTAEGTGSGSTGLDSSGNSNNMNFENHKGDLPDTPSNNFCTWNVQSLGTSGSDTWDISMGGTELTYSSSGWNHFFGTMPVSSGKWYWEAEYQNMAYSLIGWHDVDAIVQGAEPTTGVGGFVNYNGGEMRVDHTETTSDYGTVADNSIVGIALNMDDDQVTIYRNNTAIVSNYSIGNSAGKTVVPFIRLHATAAASCSTNFGSAVSFAMPNAGSSTDANGYGTFYYAPPTNYYALCTKNLAEFG